MAEIDANQEDRELLFSGECTDEVKYEIFESKGE